jgi:hypothetical protein
MGASHVSRPVLVSQFILILILAQIPIAKAEVLPRSFTDQRLEKVLGRSKAGIIYFWSPHMPLSVKGYKEAAQVARELEISFLPLLDPFASIITKKKTYKIESKTLIDLGVLDHFPGVLVYSKGKITSPLLQGYEQIESLKTFVKEYL